MKFRKSDEERQQEVRQKQREETDYAFKMQRQYGKEFATYITELTNGKPLQIVISSSRFRLNDQVRSLNELGYTATAMAGTEYSIYILFIKR